MTTKINGRTPEEIIYDHMMYRLRRPNEWDEHCAGSLTLKGRVETVKWAYNYIQQLERERDEARNDLDTISYANTELHSAYEAMKRERDAAVKDMKDATWCGCHVCGHYYRPDPAVREYACRKFGSFKEHDYIANDGSMFCGAFEWRGSQEVN